MRTLPIDGALVAAVHNRMPVILQPENYDLWLDPGVTGPTRVTDLLRPFEARLMRSYPVSWRVNRVESDDAECSKAVSLESESNPSLF